MCWQDRIEKPKTKGFVYSAIRLPEFSHRLRRVGRWFQRFKQQIPSSPSSGVLSVIASMSNYPPAAGMWYMSTRPSALIAPEFVPFNKKITPDHVLSMVLYRPEVFFGVTGTVTNVPAHVQKKAALFLHKIRSRVDLTKAAVSKKRPFFYMAVFPYYNYLFLIIKIKKQIFTQKNQIFGTADAYFYYDTASQDSSSSPFERAAYAALSYFWGEKVLK